MSGTICRCADALPESSPEAGLGLSSCIASSASASLSLSSAESDCSLSKCFLAKASKCSAIILRACVRASEGGRRSSCSSRQSRRSTAPIPAGSRLRISPNTYCISASEGYMPSLIAMSSAISSRRRVR